MAKLYAPYQFEANDGSYVSAPSPNGVLLGASNWPTVGPSFAPPLTAAPVNADANLKSEVDLWITSAAGLTEFVGAFPHSSANLSGTIGIRIAIDWNNENSWSGVASIGTKPWGWAAGALIPTFDQPLFPDLPVKQLVIGVNRFFLPTNLDNFYTAYANNNYEPIPAPRWCIVTGVTIAEFDAPGTGNASPLSSSGMFFPGDDKVTFVDGGGFDPDTIYQPPPGWYFELLETNEGGGVLLRDGLGTYSTNASPYSFPYAVYNHFESRSYAGEYGRFKYKLPPYYLAGMIRCPFIQPYAVPYVWNHKIIPMSFFYPNDEPNCFQLVPGCRMVLPGSVSYRSGDSESDANYGRRLVPGSYSLPITEVAMRGERNYSLYLSTN